MKPPLITLARPPKRAAKARKHIAQTAELPTVVKAYSPASVQRWSKRYGDRWRKIVDGEGW
jgi:hypothetical protein